MLNGKVEKLEATVAQQQKQIETLKTQLREQAETFTAQFKEQATQIQKVSAQFEVSKTAPQVVNSIRRLVDVISDCDQRISQSRLVRNRF